MPDPLRAGGLTPTSTSCSRPPGRPANRGACPPFRPPTWPRTRKRCDCWRWPVPPWTAATPRGAWQLAERARALRRSGRSVRSERAAAGSPADGNSKRTQPPKRGRRAAPSGVVPAYDPGTDSRDPYPVQQSVYDPAQDRSRMQPAQALGSPRDRRVRSRLAPSGPWPAARDRNCIGKVCWPWNGRTGPRPCSCSPKPGSTKRSSIRATRQALRDKLTLLRVAMSADAGGGAAGLGPGSRSTPNSGWCATNCSATSPANRAPRKRCGRPIPRGSLTRLQRLREQVEQETVDPTLRRQMLNLVDRSIRETEGYIQQNLADIELRNATNPPSEEIDRGQQNKLDKQNKLAELVEQFNNLIDEQRFAEAEVIAKQAHELEPESEVVRSMLLTSKFAWRVQEQNQHPGRQGRRASTTR